MTNGQGMIKSQVSVGGKGERRGKGCNDLFGFVTPLVTAFVTPQSQCLPALLRCYASFAPPVGVGAKGWIGWIKEGVNVFDGTPKTAGEGARAPKSSPRWASALRIMGLRGGWGEE
jgi:hypothetical protein